VLTAAVSVRSSSACGAGNDVAVAPSLQTPRERRPGETAVAGDVDARIQIHHSYG